MNYETVCGLEVHTELATKTKIFCACTTDFGGEPNSHCCEVCTGMPGALPVLNERVVEFAVRCGLALNCEINTFNRFDRKNYFYPDLPKAYQISQLYMPICKNGWVEIEDSVNGGKKKIRIREIHMEEDAGKLIHKDGRSYINYNRAGVPLLEIVSEPDISSGAEAAEYTDKLREILRYIGVSDCKMQEGSLRADVNVSVREKGSAELGTRTEMKNLGSLKAVRAAVDFEAKRQIKRLESGRAVNLETRRWDENKNVSVLMRTKEEASDYKYFPEPDIPPLALGSEYIERIKASLPELPEEKRGRYTALGLTKYDAAVITSEPEYAELFEKTARLTDSAKLTANWIMGEYMMLKKERVGNITPEALAQIICFVRDGRITRESGKEVLFAAFADGAEPLRYIEANGLEIISDSELIESVCSKIVSENVKAVREYKKGKEKAFNFLFGQCMRELKGKASPELIKEILKEKLG